ncbi:SCP2 sterol-binding domain-containing protein [Mangrovivirga sp. M17]|uniref:Sterol-binding protein n=2 Tax=Mangrovivirga TaxID=2858886 RepID=A0A4D7JJR3_9BACT|nr:MULTISPECIES: SCP2 sterol-binding domain-containing protein [Mangrovivirga]MCX2744856.1 SCP2 sterol-binding domain-containing protein [Mangrovivirga halotolerans]QCK13690.1 sterol-binding protein [Mangrovivirga cuniculi]
MDFNKATEFIQSKAAKSSEPLGNKIKFTFPEGVIHVDGDQQPMEVTNEDKEADCNIKMKLNDFEKLITGNLNPMMAVMSGKIKIDGNMGVAMKLTQLVN